MKTNRIAVAVAVLAVGFAGAVFAGKAVSKRAIILSADEVKFFPMNPNDPNGGQMAIASGDPQKGASAIYLKLKPGTPPIHTHSSDYHAVLISGKARHWEDGKESSAKVMGPGSYWFQPAKQHHGDHCVGPEDCLVFISLDQKFDFVPKQ